MKLTNSVYCYPWTSFYENNANSYYFGGSIKALIDPGHNFAFESLLDRMKEDGISSEDVEVVIFTHSHPDHFESVGKFAGKQVKLALGVEEADFLKELGPSFWSMFGMEMPEFEIDIKLEEGELQLGDETVQIIHTPGHSPGSKSIYWPSEGALVTGDVIFDQNVGRTDFPGGDSNLLKQSIERLSTLGAEYLLPGHMDIVRGKDKVSDNFNMVKQYVFPYL